MKNRIAVSCDEHGPLVEALLRLLRKRGLVPIYYGPGEGDDAQDWPVVTRQALAHIRSGETEQAIVMCWTGTGCSIVANKTRGIRAALCHDAATAKGARVWNHANVLALSQRATSEAVLEEILEAWFSTPFSDDDWNRKQVLRVDAMDRNTGGGQEPDSHQ